jgi:hypothetical protein
MINMMRAWCNVVLENTLWSDNNFIIYNFSCANKIKTYYERAYRKG